MLKGGIKTKVLMLSATPVNTSLRDLRNQIYLMAEKRQDAFQEALGIGNIQSIFGVAQRAFQEWEKNRRPGQPADKAVLLETLGADFLSLLDAVTIARSREHIKRYYPEVIEKIGGFPERAPPLNLHPVTDSKGELSYEDMHHRIGAFRLALYKPSQYLRDSSDLEAEETSQPFKQRDREHWLTAMMRINLLKRLESSVHSFALTLHRIRLKIDETDRLIEEWRARGGTGQIDVRPDADEEDEEFTVGKGRRYGLDELDLDLWQQDLREDRDVLNALHEQATRVTVDRDDKFETLKRQLKEKVQAPPDNKDGRPNCKVLVFTTFSDTASYLYTNLEAWVREELNVHIALVTGGSGNHTTVGRAQFDEILRRFAPTAQAGGGDDAEIDILIATDCLSEGQDLQDCDRVVNYDIHWNPVRLMQRFGRIDRLGSRNARISMTNFWPTADLERYLDLRNRVEARMVLVDTTATGFDNPLDENGPGPDEQRQAVQLELEFRNRQLERMREEILDLEEVDDGVNLSDLTLDDFVADLLRYIRQNEKELEAAPLGLHAVVDNEISQPEGHHTGELQPGAIFCLERVGDRSDRTPNRLWPYFLVYVQEDGHVRYAFQQARKCLALFRDLAAGRVEANMALEDAFARATENGQRMERYDAMLEAALRNVTSTFGRAEVDALMKSRGARLTRKSANADPAAEFKLVTWLVITRKSGEA